MYSKRLACTGGRSKKREPARAPLFCLGCLGRSEIKLQAELDRSHLRTVSDVCDTPTAGAVHATVREVQIDVIEDIERLELELEVGPLCNVEILEKTQVYIKELGPTTTIASDISEGVASRLDPSPTCEWGSAEAYGSRITMLRTRSGLESNGRESEPVAGGGRTAGTSSIKGNPATTGSARTVISLCRTTVKPVGKWQAAGPIGCRVQ